jgi:hypothetical protein
MKNGVVVATFLTLLTTPTRFVTSQPENSFPTYQAAKVSVENQKESKRFVFNLRPSFSSWIGKSP